MAMKREREKEFDVHGACNLYVLINGHNSIIKFMTMFVVVVVVANLSKPAIS